MSGELPKTYDPKSVQDEVLGVWDAERCFHAEPTDAGEAYSIVIPPPNVTAALHLGHALNNTIQDILVRRARMQGKCAVWLPGTDHAGIATQTVVEKRVLREEGKRRTDFARDEFVKKIQAWKDEYEKVILGQLKAMGCSCDWDRTAFTMDEPRAKAVREAFFQLFKAGLIYRGKRLVNWDPVTLTALADDEVEMEEIDGNFYFLKYPLCNAEGKTLNTKTDTALSAFRIQNSEFLAVTVATTRPETMLGDTAVAINPTDPRAAALRGKFVKLPIVNRIIPIIEDDYVVKPVQYGGDPADPKAQMATGFLKVTPAHDPNDYDIGRRHNLPVINVMAPDASISLDYGWSTQEPDQKTNDQLKPLVGLARELARKQVVKWFKEHNLLEDIKPYRHAVGHSYRSHVPIEPYLSDQWYCRVTDQRLAGRANEVINPLQKSPSMSAPLPKFEGDEVDTQPDAQPRPDPDAPKTDATTGDGLTFYPARYAKTYQTWHENIRDWCISRQLWWGHRIPVWTFVNDKALPLDKDFWNRLEILYEWIQQGQIAVVAGGRLLTPEDTAIGDSLFEPGQTYVCVRDGVDQSIIKALEQHGFVQDPDVLDTWFSSGLWPLSTLGWPEDLAAEVARPEEGTSSIDTRHSTLDTRPSTPLQRWNPTNVLCTAREIITLWVSRMVMFNEFFEGQLPFKDVFIHAMIQDGHGQKMSKSLANGVDPLDIIDTHGADAMRFTLTSMTTHTQDVRMPVDSIDPHTGETFTPTFITDSAGYKVAAPVQEYKGKKLVSTYGLASGQANPTKEMPLARNTSSKFDLGRNFCNKLWNAARFVFSQISGAKPTAEQWAFDEKSLSIADKWILSRLSRTIAEVDGALREYRFDQYAKSCYDFFWRDFCDWYVEAAKPQMKDDARKGTTAHVLASVLDASLRLMHPMIPFVTEKVWWQLSEIAPRRGIDGWINPGADARTKIHAMHGLGFAKRVMTAQWPQAGKIDEGAEQTFTKIQEIITVIRNVRSEYKVEPRKSVIVSIKAAPSLSSAIDELKPVIELLGTCTLNPLAGEAPTDAAKALAADCELFVEGLVDKEAEAQRRAKRGEELTKTISSLKGRMANKGYIAKAPPALVQQTQDQLAAAEAELAKLLKETEDRRRETGEDS